ncbi:hypothetical protein VZT92_009221 [Zoarces viviparus]|uniref:Uncharacterized protein n=1 Tax=Zoarces viviparus TaxID=48416 RepID=A0AAW1FHF1_ZOAVI
MRRTDRASGTDRAVLVQTTELPRNFFITIIRYMLAMGQPVGTEERIHCSETPPVGIYQRRRMKGEDSSTSGLLPEKKSSGLILISGSLGHKWDLSITRPQDF